jgi:methionyl-tRNA synthetase
MSQPAPAYFTTPIYYVNDRPHIGHCYTTLLADVAARFERLRRGLPMDAPAAGPSAPVFFLTGTDEHAEKVVTTAASRGLSPLQWADRNSGEFQTVFRELGFTYDDFIRTTQPRHTSRVETYLSALLATGDVAEGEFEGWYDVDDEAYVTETKAKDQDFKASNGKPLVRRKERNFYFKLSKYQPWLERAISTGELRVEPEARRNEVLGRLREGLMDVPITRPVTDDPATQFGIRMPGNPGHRVYVWIDALFNYLSAVDTPERRHLWPPTAHLMGKEILWFHAVIWPVILKALGRPLPRLIYAHSHYTRDGKKMSKTLGNFIDLETIRAYTGRFGVDALRWYLLTQGPLHATDADFSHAKFVEVYNAELANGLGNCSSRVGNMIEKYFAGKIPAAVLDPSSRPLAACAEAARRLGPCLEALDLAAAVQLGPFIVREVDLYINETAPFKLAKTVETDPGAKDRLASILVACAQAVRVASVLMAPAMPGKAAALWSAWNCPPPAGAGLDALLNPTGPASLKTGSPIAKGEGLFMRIDPAEAPPTPGPAPTN